MLSDAENDCDRGSAFLYSTIAHAIFPGNTSGFLLTLAVGTAILMALGWLLIRPCPYPDHVTQTAIENDDHGESDEFYSERDYPMDKGDHTQRPCISGLALMRTGDFWILFCIISLCEYFLYSVRGP